MLTHVLMQVLEIKLLALKGDYQRVIDYIEAWIPKCGCAELKLEADKRAESRRKAKGMGYNC